MENLQSFKVRALNEEVFDEAALLSIADSPLNELIEAAHEITVQKASRVFNFCAIVNAKSGKCSENCRWCAQSRHYSAHCDIYPLLDASTVIECAKTAQEAGASRFSLVTSGRKLSPREVRETAQIVRELKKETSLEICISAGLLTEKEFIELAQAGVTRCHCNLEAAESFFPTVCSSHTFDDKVKSLLAARQAGLEICSGGIIGMGESRRARAQLAIAVRGLDVPSIPINILEPIPGTPLENIERISEEEILRTIAMFRFANPKAYLRFSGGRRRLSEETTRLALRAGINSAIAGDMLTTQGTNVNRDRTLATESGYSLESPQAEN